MINFLSPEKSFFFGRNPTYTNRIIAQSIFFVYGNKKRTAGLLHPIGQQSEPGVSSTAKSKEG